MTAKPVAGWYADPANPNNERWWGGLDWTDHVRPNVAAAPVSYQPTAPVPAAAPAPQLAAPSAHAAHAAPAAHVAGSPLAPPAPAQQLSAAPAALLTNPRTFTLTTPAVSETAIAPPQTPEMPQALPGAPAYQPSAGGQPPFAPAAPPLIASPVVDPLLRSPAPSAGTPLPPPSLNGLVLTPALPPMSATPVAGVLSPAAPDAVIPQFESQVKFSPVAGPAAGGTPFALMDSESYLGSLGGDTSFGGSAIPAAQNSGYASGVTSPGWTTPAYTPAAASPTNVPAIIGFILSLLGGGLLGFILCLVALSKARKFEASGQRPVGRRLARWGIGITVLYLVVGGGIGALLATNPAVLTSIPLVSSLTPAFDQVVYQSQIASAIEYQTGFPPMAVECPASATVTAGSQIDCAVTLSDGSEIVVRSTVMPDGSWQIEQVV